jgi:hypothetical protein
MYTSARTTDFARTAHCARTTDCAHNTNTYELSRKGAMTYELSRKGLKRHRDGIAFEKMNRIQNDAHITPTCLRRSRVCETLQTHRLHTEIERHGILDAEYKVKEVDGILWVDTSIDCRIDPRAAHTP